jgi:cob(I)alamin adenosyltransferase
MKKSKIYTRTGDEGKTALVSGNRTYKSDLRIDLYGELDELNSRLGYACSLLDSKFSKEVDFIHLLQSSLFDLGSNMACEFENREKYNLPQINQSIVDNREVEIDRMDNELDELKNFILPGGSGLAAGLHLARTVVRRAERATWHAIEAYGTEPAKKGHNDGGVSPVAAKYLNRLSDLLFVLARYANIKHGGDVKWVPAANRRERPEHPTRTE